MPRKYTHVIVIGVGPEVHGLTNGIVSSTPYNVKSPFPSLFKRIRDVYPDPVLGSYCDISHLTGAVPRVSKKHHESELV